MPAITANLMKAPRIRIHFNVHEPVELVELTLAFQGIGFEYQDFTKSQALAAGYKRPHNDVKLYITKIESNCILADLAPALAMLGSITPILADVNTVKEFVKNTASMIDWLRSVAKSDDLHADDIPYSKRHITHIKNITELVGNNKGGNLGLSAIRYEASTDNDKTALEMTFSDAECREAKQGASKALQALETVEQADREKVLMYLYQTNTEDPKSTGRTGDKAIISSVSKKPLNVYFISDVDQERVRHVLDDKNHNPLFTGFIVDVNIEHDMKGRPKIYRVLRVHDVIHDDEDEGGGALIG